MPGTKNPRHYATNGGLFAVFIALVVSSFFHALKMANERGQYGDDPDRHKARTLDKSGGDKTRNDDTNQKFAYRPAGNLQS